MQYTQDQILKMAPDDASAKAGRQLATPAKWVVKSAHSKALWGDCQGSGKTPYKTIIDLTNIAFKCSCPSRKFPCKHGLGLFLLYAADPASFTTEEQLPAHVNEWLGKREEKESAKEEKVQKPVDEAARKKRADAREKKVKAGIDELRSWLKDVARTGIANVPQNPYQFSQNITARMVDAQAGGLAAQLRQINSINFYKEGWQKQLIRRLSGIYLVTDAYQRMEDYPADMKQELQTLIGWTTAKEDVLQSAAVNDRWVVLSVTTTEEGNFNTERTWLYGMQTKRFALLLQFYAGNQLPQQVLAPGLEVNGSMAFFPGLIQQRALIKEQIAVAPVTISITGFSNIHALYSNVTATLAQNPFAGQIPLILSEVKIIFDNNEWLLSDNEGYAIGLSNTEDDGWQMLAFTRGRPCSCFGMYEQQQLHLHALWADNKNFFVQ